MTGEQLRKQALDRDQVIRLIGAELPKLREDYGVQTLGLFGSYARGTPGRASDIDLLVEFDRAPSLFKYIELEQYLSDLVGAKVDLVMKSALKPAIGRHILRETILI